MDMPVQVTQPQPPGIDLKEVFANYGEAMIQFKIALGKVQQLEIQLQQVLNLNPNLMQNIITK